MSNDLPPALIVRGLSHKIRTLKRRLDYLEQKPEPRHGLVTAEIFALKGALECMEYVRRVRDATSSVPTRPPRPVPVRPMAAPCVFVVTETAERGIHTGRMRYRVQCESCNMLVHPATTGPDALQDVHRREVAEGRAMPFLGPP